MIGQMDMPGGFRYKAVFLKGKPHHTEMDDFSIRHPRMDVSRRAKIFSPFDALKGFDEAIREKEEQREFRKELSDEERDELDRKVSVLKNLVGNSRPARENCIEATVTYFSPCSDKNNAAYGHRGKYVIRTGIISKVDTDVAKSIFLDGTPIRFEDILGIEAAGVFDPAEYEWD